MDSTLSGTTEVATTLAPPRRSETPFITSTALGPLQDKEINKGKHKENLTFGFCMEMQKQTLPNIECKQIHAAHSKLNKQLQQVRVHS